jgi:hypothetical protein
MEGGAAIDRTGEEHQAQSGWRRNRNGNNREANVRRAVRDETGGNGGVLMTKATLRTASLRDQ